MCFSEGSEIILNLIGFWMVCLYSAAVQQKRLTMVQKIHILNFIYRI